MEKKILKINKLFGYNDISIDLSKRCIALVGENGVGKTTLLKIIEFLSKGDFIELLKYKFQSIELCYNNETAKIEYKDLMPNNEKLEKIIKEELYKHRNYQGYLALKDSIDGTFDANCIGLLRELIENEQLKNYCINKYFNINLSHQLNDIISKYPSEFIKIFDTSVVDSINSLVEYSKKSFFYYIRTLNATLFEVDDEVTSIIKDFFGNVEYFDMTYKYTFEDNISSKPNYFIRLLSWFIGYDGKMPLGNKICFGRKVSNIDEKMSEFSGCEEETRKWIESIYNKIFYEEKIEDQTILEELMTFVKTKGVRLEQIKKVSDEFFKEKDNMKINDFISSKYYSTNFIKDINLIAINKYKKLIGNKTGKASRDNKFYEDFYTQEVIDNYNYYIRPAILKDSIFDMDELKINNRDNQWKDYSELDDIFIEFYTENIDKFLNERTSQIDILEDLLRKYIENKKIKITPAGLLVTKGNTLEKNIGKFTLIENHNNIGLDLLSSGEKKLLLIFIICLFCEDKTLIIDEPELSLSIVWQEQLLPDLLNQTLVKKIIVATHSPSIMRDESLTEYIKFLE